MGTVAAQPHRDAIYAIADAYGSGVVSGIVPDSAHLNNGGYHCSINDLIAHGNGGDYSNTRSEDKAPPVTNTGKGFAAAGDISMSTADMIKFYGRVRPVYNDTSDPRRKYINAINCWDGSGDAVRLNFKTNSISTASADHKWHNHLDQPRMYIDTARSLSEAKKAARALISVCTGQSKAAWIAQEETDPVTPAEMQALIDMLMAHPITSPGFPGGSINVRDLLKQTYTGRIGVDAANAAIGVLADKVNQLTDDETDVLAAVEAARQEVEDKFELEMQRDQEQDADIAALPAAVVAQLANNPEGLVQELKNLMTEQQWDDFQAEVSTAE